MSDQKQTYNFDILFSPFHKEGKESPLSIVYKAFMANYELSEALDLIKEYCLASQSPENQRKSLEFLYGSSYFKELDEMIERNRHSGILENQQWAEVFNSFLARKRDKIDPYRTINQLKKLEPVSVEVEIYKTLLTIYCYYDLRQTGKGASYFGVLVDLINEVTDPLLNKYLEERLDDFWFYYHFYRNELILCRRYGFRLVKNSNNKFKVCGVHIVLALTYMLEDYEQSLYHCNEAISISDRNGYRFSHTVREKNIPFISAVSGHYQGVHTSDPIENAHLLIAKGENEEALTVLRSIENPSHLQQYYLGKALGDLDLLNKVYNAFIKDGHFFFAKLPLIEIRKIRD